MVDPIISLSELGKSFGRTVAVDAVSMMVGEGEIFGFLGANGAGKTTTIRMLCGLTRPTGGHGTIHGLDIWRDRSRLRSQFGYVPQRFSLYPDLTVLENLRFFGGAYRVPTNRLGTRIEKLLSQLDLRSRAAQWAAADPSARSGGAAGQLAQALALCESSLVGLHLGRTGYGRCLYGLLPGLLRRHRLGKSVRMERGYIWGGIATIAYKEFIHV